MHDTTRLVSNLNAIRERIEEAASRSGRSADDVTLVAVTKYVDADVCAALCEAGCRVLGESRPQALWEKAAALADRDVSWHLIGHLQRNKVRRTLPLVDLIHSADSARLLKEINQAASTINKSAHVLLEVNVSGDARKHGLRPEEVETTLRSLDEYPHVRVSGLMAMASRDGGIDRARRDFAALRELRDRLRDSLPESPLPELSMGMSGDYEAAIEEGATVVRVGSALFDGIDRA